MSLYAGAIFKANLMWKLIAYIQSCVKVFDMGQKTVLGWFRDRIKNTGIDTVNANTYLAS